MEVTQPLKNGNCIGWDLFLQLFFSNSERKPLSFWLGKAENEFRDAKISGNWTEEALEGGNHRGESPQITIETPLKSWAGHRIMHTWRRLQIAQQRATDERLKTWAIAVDAPPPATTKSSLQTKVTDSKIPTANYLRCLVYNLKNH